MILENGSKERSHVATQAHAGGGCSHAEGGRAAAWRRDQFPDVIKQLEVSEQTYSRWRNQFRGTKADDVKRLKDLMAENSRLKRIVADQVTGGVWSGVSAIAAPNSLGRATPTHRARQSAGALVKWRFYDLGKEIVGLIP